MLHNKLSTLSKKEVLIDFLHKYTNISNNQQIPLDVKRSINRLYEFNKNDFVNAVDSLNSALRSNSINHHKVIFAFGNLSAQAIFVGMFDDAKTIYIFETELFCRINNNYSKFYNQLFFIAQILNTFSRLDDAEDLCQRLIKINTEKHPYNDSNIANPLTLIANIYKEKCRYDEAEIYYLRSLKIKNKYFDRLIFKLLNGLFGTVKSDEVADTLIELADLLVETDRYSEAMPYLRRALIILESHRYEDDYQTSLCLNKLANLYTKVGRYEEAEGAYIRALKYRKPLDATSIYFHHVLFTASTLSNYANLDKILGRFVEAEAKYKEALDWQEDFYDGNHPVIGITQKRLAIVIGLQNRQSEARNMLMSAINILKVSYGIDHPEVGHGLYCLANLSEDDTATEDLYKKALKVFVKAYGVMNLNIAYVLDSYSQFMSRKDQISSAIFLAKKSVNIVQNTRKDVTKIDPDKLNQFDNTVQFIYTNLAALLINSCRFYEAEHVLGLLKEEEFFDFVRRDSVNTDIANSGISYNLFETPVNGKYDLLSLSFSTLCIRKNALKQNKSRTTEEEMEYKDLQALIETDSRNFDLFLDELYDNLGPEKAQHVDNVTDFMSTLWDLDAETAVIYTLTTKETFYTILITRNFRKSFSHAISSDVLGMKVLHFRDLIKMRDVYDMEQLAKELYEIVLGQLVSELRGAGITTLLWMLEGALRLLPVSALHDGTYYIVNLYQNVFLTTKSRENLLAAHRHKWNALGMGVTLAHENFTPLPSVKEELEGIVKIGDTPSGILDGDILIDNEFTWDAMSEKIDGRYQAIHIASHFNLDPSNETKSYLLLGDGNHLTLDKLKHQQSLFRGVDLLTFSACSTGVGTASMRGREIDGIGYIGETQGAKTVMATLWPVADESTSLLMKDFYRRREAGATKIEALRQAQLGMLNGSTKPTKKHAERSGEKPFRFEVDPDKPFAHPYYWAPFILIGNFR
ncbi:MAG: CHAT domain-containing protein [Desulfuromonadaceae bacterium]